MQQVLFRIPIRISDWTPEGIPIYGFGMMLFLTFLICTWLASRQAEKEGLPREFIQDLAIWIFLGGILGARITFLLVHDLPLWQFFRIWDGGLVLYGSVIGGLAGYLLAYVLVIRKHRVSTWKLADIIAPATAVGLCLGHIGCFLNGCCYGGVACASCPAVGFPLAAAPRFALVKEGYQTAAGFTLTPDEAARVGAVGRGSPAEASGLKAGDVIVQLDGHDIRSAFDVSAYLADPATWPRGKSDLQVTVRHAGEKTPVDLAAIQPRTLGLHPTQLYESISMILLFFLLTAYYPLRRHDGEVMALLMVCYGVHRYINELLRSNPRPITFESNVSILLVVLGLALGLWLWRQPVQYKPAVAT